jgi:hypothetical protein
VRRPDSLRVCPERLKIVSDVNTKPGCAPNSEAETKEPPGAHDGSTDHMVAFLRGHKLFFFPTLNKPSTRDIRQLLAFLLLTSVAGSS